METYIRFMGAVNPDSMNRLIQIIDNRIYAGYKVIHLLISSGGGSVQHGLSLYNYLKGLPVEVRTYNFGTVDSIAVVMFCAGSKRYSVPHARFLIHGVSFFIQAQGMVSYEEKQMEEFVKALKMDRYNIAKVIADTVKIKTLEEVELDMLNRTMLDPEDAVRYGLVHEIKSELIPANATDLQIVYEIPPQQNPVPQQPIQMMPPVQQQPK
jgi:ATP-dependent protease ClpP protease subunit